MKTRELIPKWRGGGVKGKVYHSLEAVELMGISSGL